MNVWKIVSTGQIVKAEEPSPIVEEGKIKVRVTKVLLTNTDAAVLSGTMKISYPLVPGRFAVGIVNESNCPRVEKGARVLLHTFRDVPDNGTAKKNFAEDDTLVCGQTTNGFLSDFVIVNEEDVTLLPDSVSDENALLAHHVALAKAAIDRIEAGKGNHIAVVGGGIVGLLICQLLIYQQASPVFIDGKQDILDFARKSGVYYSMLADDDLIQKVGEVTGGRLTSGSVFLCGSGMDKKIPFLVCASESNVALCGFPAEGLYSSFDLSLLIRKRLNLYGVSVAAELETALNLIVNKAVDLSIFQMENVSPDRAEEEFVSLATIAEKQVNALSVLSLV